jgi:hypothetical protein
MALPFTATPVSAPSTMTSDLTPEFFKFNNEKILKEIDKLKNQDPSGVIKGFDRKNYKVDEILYNSLLDGLLK